MKTHSTASRHPTWTALALLAGAFAAYSECPSCIPAIPQACTGKSLLPIIRRQVMQVRDVLHGEHAGQYDYNTGVHYLVGNQFTAFL